MNAYLNYLCMTKFFVFLVLHLVLMFYLVLYLNKSDKLLLILLSEVNDCIEVKLT